MPATAADPGDIGTSIVRGGIKTGARFVATMMDMLAGKGAVDPGFEASYRSQNPKATADQVSQAYEAAHPLQTRNAQHLQDAANWLKTSPQGFWENVGGIGEQLLEFMGPGEVLKLVGPAAEVAGAAGKADQVKNLQQVMQTLIKNPKLAGLVAVGLKGGAEAGAQTYMHTEDPTQTAIGAAMGGGIPLAAEGAVAGARALRAMGPVTRELEGQPVMALKSQLNEYGRFMEGGAKGAPEVQRSQQAAMNPIIANVAKRAVANILDQVNSTRQLFSPWGPNMFNPARMLAAPPEFNFTLGGGGETAAAAPATEVPTEPMVQRAAAAPESGRIAPAGGTPEQRAQLGSMAAVAPQRVLARPQAFTTAAATGEELAAGTQAQSQIDQDTMERLGIKKAQGKKLTPGEKLELQRATARESAGAPAAAPQGDQWKEAVGPWRGDVVTGGPSLSTNDPIKAQRWLTDHENMLTDADLNPEERAFIENRVKSLSDQLDMYHASRPAPVTPDGSRLAPINVQAVTDQVEGMDHARDLVVNEMRPVFSEVNRLSGGNFDMYRQQVKDAERVVKDVTTSPEARDNALKAIKDINGKIQQTFLDSHGKIAPGDLTAARKAFFQASKLGEFQAQFQRMTNGVSRAQTTPVRGLKQIYTGDAKLLGNWLDDGNNREVMEGLMGKEGVDNLYDITLGLSDAQKARDLSGIYDAVKDYIKTHSIVGGLPGLAGATIAKMTGQPLWEGYMAGHAAGEMSRYVLRAAAHNPAVGRAVTYAAEHGIDPRVAAPYIVRMINAPMQNPEAKTGGQ